MPKNIFKGSSAKQLDEKSYFGDQRKKIANNDITFAFQRKLCFADGNSSNFCSAWGGESCSWGGVDWLSSSQQQL